MQLSRPQGGLFAPCLLAAALSLAPKEAGAAFGFVEPKWDSCSQFLELARKELGRDRVILTAELDWQELAPEDGVLLLHPTKRVSFTEASAFLGAGGRMALVDDYGEGDSLLRRFHINRISAPSDAAELHNDNPELPIAMPALGKQQSPHPIVRGVGGVITNHPTALQTDIGVQLTPVLDFPTADGGSVPFALVGVIGDAKACGLAEEENLSTKHRCGRLFAMADPSTLIDLMMNFEGNRQLAVGMLNYLVEDDVWGPRGGRLFVLSGEFLQTGHYGGQTDLERGLAARLEALEQQLAELRDEGLPKRGALVLAALATLLAAGWAWRSSGRLYERPTPRYARAIPIVSQGGVPGRAAVLAAPTTRPLLLLVELKSAVEGYLRDVLFLSPTASAQEILDAIRRSEALDPQSQIILAEQFADMAKAEQSMIGGQAQSIGVAAVADVHSRLQELLPRVRPRLEKTSS